MALPQHRSIFEISPWWYALIIPVFAVGIVFFSLQNKKGGSSEGTESGVADRPSQAVLMNILNRFQREDASDDAVRHRSLISRTIAALRDARVDAGARSAQRDLIHAFSLWEQHLEAGKDTEQLRETFLAIGKRYAWLNTLVWLIALNRL